MLSVHDGDTFTAYVDRGHEEYAIWDIRLKDVTAPELKQLGGLETLAFVHGWLQDHGDGTDWPFHLETFRTPRSDKDVETLSRWVGVVRAADGAVLNTEVQEYVTLNSYPTGS